MQQKMLSDQPLRQVRQTKSRSNINDGFCALGLCLWWLSFGGFVRWLAAVPLLPHFCSCSFTLLPPGVAIDRTHESWHKKRNNRLQFTA